ncbi:hypothetical protein STEG23_020625 [Scotinomys teguina]
MIRQRMALPMEPGMTKDDQRENQYLIPESVDLECVRYCIVYDSNTSSLELRIRQQKLQEEEEEEERDDEEEEEENTELLPGPAVELGQILIHLTRQPVYILRGGYECFSCLYHFFRTQKVIWMPQELDAFQPYPVEIIPGKIFLGKFSQACNARIHKDLKIKAHVNISMEATPYFVGDADKLLHIKIEDSSHSDLFTSFRHICHFMELHLRLHSVILVFSTRGISRSIAAVIAFLMHYNEETLKRTWAHVKKCKGNMRPNRGLVTQLLEWEKVIHGDYITDISEPIY